MELEYHIFVSERSLKNTLYITRYCAGLANVKNIHLYALHQESFVKDLH